MNGWSGSGARKSVRKQIRRASRPLVPGAGLEPARDYSQRFLEFESKRYPGGIEREKTAENGTVSGRRESRVFT
jgi:hypothetical protein